jgi:hypothetical protein
MALGSGQGEAKKGKEGKNVLPSLPFLAFLLPLLRNWRRSKFKSAWR